MSRLADIAHDQRALDEQLHELTDDQLFMLSMRFLALLKVRKRNHDLMLIVSRALRQLRLNGWELRFDETNKARIRHMRELAHYTLRDWGSL